MGRPGETVVVKDDAGVARQRDPIDAKEIVEGGGTYEVTEKDMAAAATEDDNHPVGQTGTEFSEAFTAHPVENVEAKSGPAAKAQAEAKNPVKTTKTKK